MTESSMFAITRTSNCIEVIRNVSPERSLQFSCISYPKALLLEFSSEQSVF